MQQKWLKGAIPCGSGARWLEERKRLGITWVQLGTNYVGQRGNRESDPVQGTLPTSEADHADLEKKTVEVEIENGNGNENENGHRHFG